MGENLQNIATVPLENPQICGISNSTNKADACVPEVLTEQNLPSAGLDELYTIETILKEAGINSYDPQVVTHLLSYIDKYINTIITQSKTYMQHAGRTDLSVADVQMALQQTAKKCNKRFPHKKLVKLAQHHNKTALPPIQEQYGLRIPPEGCSLTQTNYKMKSSNYSGNIHLMDLTNRQLMASNTNKNPVFTRAAQGNMGMKTTLHMTPQRIILKPQFPNTFNIKAQIEQDSRKRFKYSNVLNL